MTLLKTILLGCITFTLTAHANEPIVANEDGQRAQLFQELRQLSDDELKDYFRDAINDNALRWNEPYEMCLIEMIRRGESWVPFLEEVLEQFSDEQQTANDRINGSQNNLELLTAIQRIKKQPDPIKVIIKPFDDGNLSSVSLPRLKVQLSNVSSGEVNVSMGGNYRSGRPTRWRVLITDDSGNSIPVRPWLYGIGGGIMSSSMLPPGESQDHEIILDHMVDVVPAGNYQLQVLYHDSQAILSADSLDHYLVCKSEPVEIRVQPVRIALDSQRKTRIHELLAAIDDDQKVRLLSGTYGDWAEDFVSRESAIGQLLTIGLPTLPPILDELNQSDSSPQRRAHLLALLYSITGLNDPGVSSALGTYRYLRDGWSFGGGASFGQSSGTRSRGSINEADQKRLIESWNRWAKSSLVINQTDDR